MSTLYQNSKTTHSLDQVGNRSLANGMGTSLSDQVSVSLTMGDVYFTCPSTETLKLRMQIGIKKAEKKKKNR